MENDDVIEVYQEQTGGLYWKNYKVISCNLVLIFSKVKVTIIRKGQVY